MLCGKRRIIFSAKKTVMATPDIANWGNSFRIEASVTVPKMIAIAANHEAQLVFHSIRLISEKIESHWKRVRKWREKGQKKEKENHSAWWPSCGWANGFISLVGNGRQRQTKKNKKEKNKWKGTESGLVLVHSGRQTRKKEIHFFSLWND